MIMRDGVKTNLGDTIVQSTIFWNIYNTHE